MGDLFYEPERETITNIDGSVYEKIIHPDGHVEMKVIRPPYPPPSYYSSGEEIFNSMIPEQEMWKRYVYTDEGSFIREPVWSDYAEIRKYFESEEERKVNVVRKESYNKGEHIVACYDEKDLSVENILKTLSAIKGKLMMDIAPIHIKTIECWITPQVRQNIVTASKKLKMYGKKRPIIARFDEYGNRLPDEIDIGTTNGITLKIIDPDKYGKYYIELKGIEFPREDIYMDPDDLPF